jgi:hypothetical protein
MKRKGKLTISQHARQRWAERFSGRNLESELARAVPFGAQRGNSTVLLHEDAAFVVQGGNVVTCLTKEMAITNMQISGVRFNAFIESECEVKLPVNSNRPDPITVGQMVQQIASCDKRAVTIIAQVLCDASEDDLKHLAATTGLRTVCQMIEGLKRKHRKAYEHARLTESRLSSIRKATMNICGYQTCRQIIDQADKIRKEKAGQ